MEFPELPLQKTALINELASGTIARKQDISVVASPYRICPLGAHIDHQGGPVLGMTINAHTLMAFCCSGDSLVQLKSKNYPGTVSFDLHDIDESTGSFWGVYPRAAALALKETYTITNGISGLLNGMLPGCGLSSSASVLLAYLSGLAAANSLVLSPWELVHLTKKAEQKYIGLNNGILDQTSIVFGKKDHLLHIDTLEETVSFLDDPLDEQDYRILVAYSGHSRELTTSGYNSRVDECRAAAQHLSALAGKPEEQILSGVTASDYARFGDQLDPISMRRSAHFFGESQRVSEGVAAWSDGNIVSFGRLMNESCRSSMEKYECGIQPIHDLQQIVSAAEGMYGSRFMGGGFGGCVVGFVKSAHAQDAVEHIAEAYRKLHPEVADQTAVYLARSDDGVRMI